MQRNIEYRVEVTTPILDRGQKEMLFDMLETQLSDNTKARLLTADMQNEFVQKAEDAMPIRSQEAFYSIISNFRFQEKLAKTKTETLIKKIKVKKINGGKKKDQHKNSAWSNDQGLVKPAPVETIATRTGEIISNTDHH